MYLEDTYGDNIRTAYRHFALSFHDKAPITGEATEAAGAQGKFWEMHDLLYERQQEWGQLSGEALQAKLVDYAEELGLDAERFAQELADHVYLDKVNADTQVAVQAGLPGTPSYIINGVVYPIDQFGLHPMQIIAFIELLMLKDRMYTTPPPQVIDPDKDYEATIRTEHGDVIIELYADRAPINVNSFAFLAQDGWYDGQAFFYVEPGQAAYSGDPTNSGMALPHSGYTCSDEISTDMTFDEAGMLALYTPSPNLNSSMFFITYEPQPDDNGKFTIIGRVVEGMDVVESLTQTQPGPNQPPPDVIETILIEEQ
jgi:cyclophilin family peptidyl-prolyl cis-trans isomerase